MFTVRARKQTMLLEDILKVVSEFDILSHYLFIDKIPIVISSPLREDKNPSMGLYSPDGYKIYFTDFKTKEKGGTFDLLSKAWGLTFRETIEKISDEINNIKKIATSYQEIDPSRIESNFSNKIKPKQIVMSSSTELKVKVREWRQYDLEYWGQFGINLEWLKFGKIYPISHTFSRSNKKEKWDIIPADKYAYAYVEHKDGKETIKIYQPFNKRFKWRNKHNSSVWDLWEQLPQEGDKLIITSSRKDALTIWANTGIPSVSLQSETTMPKKHVVKQLKKRFKNIYILYDNDFDKEVNTGKVNAQNLANTFDLIYIELPEEYQAKDPSDFIKKYGADKLKQLILSIL